MRNLTLILNILIPAIALANTYLTENFSKYIPSTFKIINADGMSLQPNIYSHLDIDDEAKTAWTTGQLTNGYGRVAMAPTRKTDAKAPASSWMILPPVTIADEGAVLRWEARSLHTHYPESYNIAVRALGTDTWEEVYACDNEKSIFTLHCVHLSKYVGQEIEIAFVATTVHGFILAIDNIFIGIPEDNPFEFTNFSPHYVGVNDATSIDGILKYYGAKSPWSKIRIEGIGEVQEIEIPTLNCGDSLTVHFDVKPELGLRHDYKLVAINDQETIELYSDFISCSYYPRHHIVDRASGTWCNNCPEMEITTSRLQRKYGNEIMIIEAHIQDMLANQEYVNDYMSDFIFSIPALVPNHERSKLVYSLKSNDDYSSKLPAETITQIRAKAMYDEHGDICITSSTEFAIDIDNNSDNYRIAYMLIGDIHDPTNGFYLQTSSPNSYTGEQYYYQPKSILPEMMFFDNLPIDATVAYKGLPASLPKSIAQNTEINHSHTLAKPAEQAVDNLRVIAMVIDSNSGAILNSTVTPILDFSAINDIVNDSDNSSDAVYYDIYGRRLNAPSSGIVIKYQGNKSYKLLIN